MPLELNAKMIKDYAEKKTLHDAYEQTVKIYEDLRVHADGDVPTHIICERRPSEPQEIMDYREKIYEPMTKSPISRVISSLSKIRRSTDWNILFPGKSPAKIAKGEELTTYTGTKFPYGFTSLTNWLFGVCLKEYLIDANAVILTMPTNRQKGASEYYTPFPVVYNSPQVLDYVPDDYVILLSKKKCCYNIYDSAGKIVNVVTDGFVIHYVDKDVFLTYEQVNKEKGAKLTETFNHNLGVLPAVKMPGMFYRMCGDYLMNESRINSMLPHLNEAARLYSDLQAEIVQHVHSEKWLYMNTSCPQCNGRGKEMIGDDTCECTKCHGVGRVPTSPYSNHVLTPPQMGEEAVPTPPAGFIQKTDVALMCDKINQLFKEQIYSSIAAINMQFLDQSPINQSGIAKEVDKDELNNFVYAVAEDLVYILDTQMFIINEWRVYGLISDEKIRRALLPSIPVPEKYDLLSSNYLINEVTAAKTNGVNSFIVATLEEEYAAKKFYNAPAIAQLVTLVFRLDPMPAVSEEDKLLRLQNDGATQEDYVISSNIVPFIKRAVSEDNDFMNLEYKEQVDKMKAYAAEKIIQNSVSEQVKEGVNPMSGDGASPADLKYTVGGLTSMVEIAKAVASGLYGLDAAVALVSDRFGLTEEEARKQLGTPQTITNNSQLNIVTELT